MKKLPYDYSRCNNTECQDKFLCARFTDRPEAPRIPITIFPTPKNDGGCPYLILNTRDK